MEYENGNETGRAKIQRVLSENKYHRIESFASVPDKVLTALKTEDAMGRITPDGWAIAVTRTTVFVWDAARSQKADECFAFATSEKRAAAMAFGAADRVNLMFRTPKPASIYQPVAMPNAAVSGGSDSGLQLQAAMYVSEAGVLYIWEPPVTPPPPSAAEIKANSHALVSAGPIAPVRTIQLSLSAQETITKVGRSHLSSNQFVCGTNTGRAVFIPLSPSSNSMDIKELTRPASSVSGGSGGVTAVATNVLFGLGRMLGVASTTAKAAATRIMAVVSAGRPTDASAYVACCCLLFVVFLSFLFVDALGAAALTQTVFRAVEHCIIIVANLCIAAVICVGISPA